MIKLCGKRALYAAIKINVSLLPNMSSNKNINEIITILKKLFPEAKTALVYSSSFELLVAVILSAMCTDKAVNKTTEKLFKKYPNLESYISADPAVFEADISSINFYRNKAKNILATAKIIKNKHRGQIPKTMDEMLELPGVARKTANIVLYGAHGIVAGIPVDTHVRRLANLLGLTREEDPVKIEQDLIKIVPEREWVDFSFRLIDYGRKYCPARPHDHGQCPLSKFYITKT